MMDFSIFRPQNLTKSEPIYAYKRYAYKKKHVYLEMDKCIICKNVITDEDEGSCLRENGAEGINIAASRKGDGITAYVGDNVHIHCRKQYTRAQNSSSSDTSTLVTPPKTRSSSSVFNIAKECLFCGNTITAREENAKPKKISAVLHKDVRMIKEKSF